MDPRQYKSLSPYKTNYKTFTEVGPGGEPVKITQGSHLPEIAGKLYRLKKPIEFINAPYNFLSRDLFKVRHYDPAAEDKFVFSSWNSIEMFKKKALAQLSHLVGFGKDIGLPIIKDDERGVVLIDSDQINEWLNPKHPKHKLLRDEWHHISFLLANQDIMKKYCVVRAINVGWWVNSYSGKKSSSPTAFTQALRVFRKAVIYLRSTNAYKDAFDGLADTMGDPTTTNTGWPYYGSRVQDGVPIDRLRTVDLFEGVGFNFRNLDELFDTFSDRAKHTPLGKYTFAMAPLRRQQYGFKTAHMFKYSSMGLSYEFDRTGLNSVRTAWMASYVYNLLLSPVMRDAKALRMILPGCYHDGPAMKRRHARRKKHKYYIVEADYSNYDRFIPLDVIYSIIDILTEGYERKSLYNALAKSTFNRMQLIWPDSTGGTGDAGIVLSPDETGLFSGVKPTAEWGTLTNLIINLQACLDAGLLDEDSAFSYLTMYEKQEPGSGEELFNIQSDDDVLLNQDPLLLYRQVDAFRNLTKTAGIKTSIQVGDRFLMRHIDSGKDTPVSARVYQNTLSNETPPEDPETFVVGLAVRTDGLLGHKTFDPFETGRNQGFTAIQGFVELRILKDLLNFLKEEAKRPVPEAIALLESMVTAGNIALSGIEESKAADYGNRRLHLRDSDRHDIDKMRHAAMAALARLTLMKSQVMTGSNKLQQLIDELERDKHSPSNAYLLDYIRTHLQRLAPTADALVQKENAFYKYSMGKLKLPLSPFSKT